jgi:hypothetical protein
VSSGRNEVALGLIVRAAGSLVRNFLESETRCTQTIVKRSCANRVVCSRVGFAAASTKPLDESVETSYRPRKRTSEFFGDA